MKFLVTGGSNGMGKGVAQILAGRDNQAHEVIVLCRSEQLGAATVKELAAITDNDKISFVQCDLAKLSDVRRAISEVRSRHEFLDGLFINAGLGYAARRVETEDGMDPHFQVNYLSQFMLTLNLLDFLEKSECGGRVVFNVTAGGEIYWDDMQMQKSWGYENGIHQGMVAKRMFYTKLHERYRKANPPPVSLFGFQIPKTVWTNQLNIIPLHMKVMATVMRFFGTFITIEKCGEIMAPLFTENRKKSLERSGRFFTRKKQGFVALDEDEDVLDREQRDKLWEISLELCHDETTTAIASRL